MARNVKVVIRESYIQFELLLTVNAVLLSRSNGGVGVGVGGPKAGHSVILVSCNTKVASGLRYVIQQGVKWFITG